MCVCGGRGGGRGVEGERRGGTGGPHEHSFLSNQLLVIEVLLLRNVVYFF